jgi:hypothetical protein
MWVMGLNKFFIPQNYLSVRGKTAHIALVFTDVRFRAKSTSFCEEEIPQFPVTDKHFSCSKLFAHQKHAHVTGIVSFTYGKCLFHGILNKKHKTMVVEEGRNV